MSNPAHNKPSADERRRATQALELRISGMTWDAVAGALSYSDESGARKAVDRLLSRVEHEGVEELRQLEGKRLDAMQRAIWAQACGGDLDAIRAALSIMGRRAKLLGLDAPQSVQVSQTISDVEFANEAARLIESISSLGGTDDLLRSLPAHPATIEVNAPGAQSDSIVEAYGVETLPDDDDNWSNIVGPDDEIVAPPAVTAQPAPITDSQPDPPPELPPVQPPPMFTRRITERCDPLAGRRR